ncbi:hypothetical protein O181_063506 [Austropuccinia psidii MF-1]|uniref:Retrovirus-related Pol polyprotein from transposon TNT 1-94-like beta-barrel domain-containing protein n=1 Tax=Austropuccinia psidii MF-1 TaxID=1389203 RepID=A0A9Q3ERX1_9BASI|nr:hypothetical protein [Austropuccinia psidii MF-1]
MLGRKPIPQAGQKRRFNSKAYLAISKALISSLKPPINNQIVSDSGAAHHIFDTKRFFTSLSNFTRIPVSTGKSDRSLSALESGTVTIICKFRSITLTKCLYIPQINSKFPDY